MATLERVASVESGQYERDYCMRKNSSFQTLVIRALLFLRLKKKKKLHGSSSKFFRSRIFQEEIE